MAEFFCIWYVAMWLFCSSGSVDCKMLTTFKGTNQNVSFHTNPQDIIVQTKLHIFHPCRGWHFITIINSYVTVHCCSL
jgi:hypothetical protein